MNEDDLKKYTVKILEGSGCLFQPMTQEYTYILTCKHIFIPKIPNDKGEKVRTPMAEDSPVSILKHEQTENGWKEVVIPFTLKYEENIFMHPDADIVILKIPYLEGYDKIVVEPDPKNLKSSRLCGFPEEKNGDVEGERYTSYSAEEFISSGNFNCTIGLPSITSDDNIKGMSGGGFLKIVGDHILICGIQSKMATEANHALGRVGMIPMKYIDDIISIGNNGSKLAKLLPYYLKSFSFFKDEIFAMDADFRKKNIQERLTHILKLEAQKIQISDITPHAIRDYLKEKLLMVEQGDKNLQERKIWALWLELLTILNITKSKTHKNEDLTELFNQIRFFYSNVKKDFWNHHLNDLPNLNYEGLQNKGVVVVSTDIPSLKEPILNLQNIPADIGRAARMEADEIESLQGPPIDGESHNPFERYKFINLSVFKETIVEEVGEAFTDDKMENCLKTLKNLYEEYISNE